jgi:sterol 14-demethylase
VLGQALEFGRHPLAFLEANRRRQGNVFAFTVAGREFIFLAGPEAHDAYFRAPDDQLSQREVYKFTVPLFGKGIAYDATPDVMAEQLGFLYPALRDQRMRTYAQLMDEQIRQFTDTWGDQGEIDLVEAMNELTVYIASRTLLGEEIRQSLGAGFAEHYDTLHDGLGPISFFWPTAPTPANRRRDHARVEIGRIIARVVAERRATGRTGEDFLQTLMEAHYSDGRPLTDDEITGLLVTTLFAGQHTSKVLSAWVGVLLMQHPEWIARIRDEIGLVYGDDVSLSMEATKKQDVLERCVREAERMYPPLIMLMRKVLRPFEIGPYVLPPGALAMVSPAVSHRMPEVFADPHRFDPDRYLPPREEHKRQAFTLITFGGGRHRCIGMHFAYMQVKAIWTQLLHRFDLELGTAAPSPDFSSWVTGPEQPVYMRYRRRTARDVAHPRTAAAS